MKPQCSVAACEHDATVLLSAEKEYEGSRVAVEAHLCDCSACISVMAHTLNAWERAGFVVRSLFIGEYRVAPTCKKRVNAPEVAGSLVDARD